MSRVCIVQHISAPDGSPTATLPTAYHRRTHRRASALPGKVRPPIRRHWDGAAHQPKHLIHSSHPLSARDKKLKDGAPCIGPIHTSAAVGTGTVLLLPHIAPGHDCAVITRPLVPQWAHVRRPPIGQLSHLMKEAIGRNQAHSSAVVRVDRGALAPTQSDAIRRNQTQSDAIRRNQGSSLAPTHSRRLASGPGTASPSHAQTWRTLGTIGRHWASSGVIGHKNIRPDRVNISRRATAPAAAVAPTTTPPAATFSTAAATAITHSSGCRLRH